MNSFDHKSEEEDEEKPLDSPKKSVKEQNSWHEAAGGDIQSFEEKRNEMIDFLLNFEKMMSYKVYFPQNNYMNVIKKLMTKKSFSE